ncbi:HNH endonuclease family protein [Planococcus sp. APC 4015]|nr:HNH endonuclease family protein [Planococcus sp. APC 4015]
MRWLTAIIAALLVGGVIGYLLGSASTISADRPTTPDAASTAEPIVSTTPDSEPTAGESTPSAAASSPQASRALDALMGLPVVAGQASTQYDRDFFGSAWTDVDRNGCDTRNDILGRDLLEPTFKADTNGCKVLSGVLVDPYDGRSVDFVSGSDTSVLVQIDHVVALGWAWHHGGEYWSDDVRVRFANDPVNLVAASEQMNQEKSAFGPSEWLPPVAELRCPFIEQWVEVLVAYGLSINESDRNVASAVLAQC